MPKQNQTVSVRLRKLVEEQFGTQVELARALEIKPQTLTKYISGEYLPGNTIQTKLRALGVDVEKLMTGKSARGKSTGVFLDNITSERIGAILSRKFLVDREHDLNNVALRLGISAQRLESFVSGKKSMPLSVLIEIASLAHDLSFLEPLFEKTRIEVKLIPPQD
jgi:plasmid maintenance system antidote protein VapI